MPSFLINYGGPAPQLSSLSSGFAKTLENCEAFYKSKAKSIAFSRQGLNLTYYQVGIHRMLKVELPQQIENDLKSSDLDTLKNARTVAATYRKAKIRASDFNTGKYKLLANNCVSAVSHTLNSIDASILGGDKKINPLSLDSEVNKELSFEHMVQECLCGDIIEVNKQNINYIHSDPIAHQVWNDVMTDMSSHKQKAMKSQLKAIHQQNDATQSKDSIIKDEAHISPQSKQ